MLIWEELLIAPVSGAEEPGAFAGVLEEVSGRSASSQQKKKGRRRAPGPKARQIEILFVFKAKFAERKYEEEEFFKLVRGYGGGAPESDRVFARIHRCKCP